MPNILCFNPDITCPKRPDGRSGRGNLQDASDSCAWPVSVPTRIVAAVLFALDTGASGVKYHPLAPEFTIAVSCLDSLVAIRMTNLRSHFPEILLFLCWQVDSGLPNGSRGILKLAGKLTESVMVGLWVGCGLINKELFSVLLALRTSLFVPRCHFKQDFHQRGRLSSFISNSKKSLDMCQVSLFQLGQYLPEPLLVTSPPPPPFLANTAVNISTFFERR